MSIHQSDPNTLQHIAKRRHIEEMRRAERQRLTASTPPASKLRGSAAAGLRGLADRLAPQSAAKASPAGGG